MATARQEMVWAYVRQVPPGRVMTYSQVAKKAGVIPRFVGTAMTVLPDDTDVPWWRVVRSDGSISQKAPDEQRKLLEAEGVSFDERGRIDLDKFGWPP